MSLPEQSEAERPEDERPPQVHLGSRPHVVLASEHQGGVHGAEHEGLTPAGETHAGQGSRVPTTDHRVQPGYSKVSS